MNCYIYVIGREEGPVKIGISSNPRSRLGTIQTGCPFRVKLFLAMVVQSRADALRHEGGIHSDYADKRLSGEWFDIDAELGIEAVITSLEIEEHFRSRAQQ